MAKKVKITDQRKIRGIRRRWLINSVGVVLLVLVLALATFSAAIWSYYYSSTTSDLQRRAERYTGKLPPLKPGGRTVGLVYWRDGTVLDEIKRNDEL